MSYVFAHLNTRAYATKVKMGEALMSYAYENFEEVTEGKSRFADFDLNCALVEWYLAAFGLVDLDLQNDLHRLRYVCPEAFLIGPVGAKPGDVVLLCPRLTSEVTSAGVCGVRDLVYYDNKSRMSQRVAVIPAMQYSYIFRVTGAEPKQECEIPEVIYEQFKESYVVSRRHQLQGVDVSKES